MLKKDEIFSPKRLNIDRKMVGILSLFTVLGFCLVIIIVVATDTMSALRAYSSLQTHWTEQRKEAVYLVTEFIQIGNESDMDEFYRSVGFIEELSRVREELYREDTNRDLVRRNLLAAGMQPGDINDMIVTFKRFHSFPDFARAIRAWIESERLLGEISGLAAEAEEMIGDNRPTGDRRGELTGRIRELDRQLTQEQYDLAAALSDGTAFLTDIILWISLSLGIILLCIGLILSIRFLKSIRQWKRLIEFSEQRYKSLYERNPNAVFSVSMEGEIVQGNRAMREITGFDGEPQSLQVSQLYEPEQRNRVELLLKKAAGGDPQSFETRWMRKDKERLPVYVTYMPIYVDNKIVGVFGLAEDISFQKEAENRIKQQLEEKNFLLSEIHDRVKNNLALISGLIELQKQNTGDRAALDLLESTKARIHSMAIVHERLYQVESFASIRMDDYIRDLISSLEHSFEIDDSHYKITVDMETVTLDIKRAVPCGLLLSEIIVNAFKYVLKSSEDGELYVGLKKRKDNKIHIRVKDNGKGLGADFDIEEQETLGMTLIRLLIQQLDITMEINSEEGTEYDFYLEEELPVLKSA